MFSKKNLSRKKPLSCVLCTLSLNYLPPHSPKEAQFDAHNSVKLPNLKLNRQQKKCNNRKVCIYLIKFEQSDKNIDFWFITLDGWKRQKYSNDIKKKKKKKLRKTLDQMRRELTRQHLQVDNTHCVAVKWTKGNTRLSSKSRKCIDSMHYISNK